MRYRLDLGYLGTNYHGWQRQPNAHTVQAEVENALCTLLRCPVDLVGAGRTDTGVHALGYAAHFDYNGAIDSPAKFCHALNGILPGSIAIHSLTEVDGDFHARFSATSRQYIYLISREKNPFLAPLAYQYTAALDFAKLEASAHLLEETSDFASFCKAGSDQGTTICKVSTARWSQEGGLWKFSITADRFLRNMVRALVGSMLQVGSGNWSLARFKQAIEAQDRSLAGPSAEPQGLFLASIGYPHPYPSTTPYPALPTGIQP